MGKRKYLDAQGLDYDSVTTVTDMWPKPALYPWYAKLGWTEARAQLKEAGEKGKAFHDLVERYLWGEAAPTDSMQPYLTEPFRHFVDWAKSVELQPICLEYQVADLEWRVAGTLDSLCLVNGRLSLPDWKSGTGIYEDYFLQASAYTEMLLRRLRKGPQDPIDEKILLLLEQQGWVIDRLIVRCGVKNKDFEVKELPWFGTKEAPGLAHSACLQTFLHCLGLLRWKQGVPSKFIDTVDIKNLVTEDSL